MDLNTPLTSANSRLEPLFGLSVHVPAPAALQALAWSSERSGQQQARAKAPQSQHSWGSESALSPRAAGRQSLLLIRLNSCLTPTSSLSPESSLGLLPSQPAGPQPVFPGSRRAFLELGHMSGAHQQFSGVPLTPVRESISRSPAS